jgi:hypothetical protein
MTPKLLPCPFCGGEAVIERCKDETHPGSYVECGYGECMMSPSGPILKTAAEAAAAWNTRDNEAVIAERDRLLAVVEAADAWDKAKHRAGAGNYTAAMESLSAAVDAWRKAGGK